jgi:hypothetical protein
MTDTLTINAGTDDNGNNSIIATLKDENGNVVDTTVFSANDTDNNYSKIVLRGTENTSDSITVYRSGKTVLLKAIELTDFNLGNNCTDANGDKYLKATEGWYFTGIHIPSKYAPEKNEFFYNESIIFKETLMQTWPVSIGIHNNELCTRLERSSGLTKAPTSVNHLNFTLIWLKQ